MDCQRDIPELCDSRPRKARSKTAFTTIQPISELVRYSSIYGRGCPTAIPTDEWERSDWKQEKGEKD